MKRNNGYLEINFDYNYQDLVDEGIISSLNRIKNSFYLNENKLFFKEEDMIYYELVGSKICKLLEIDCVSYDMAMINFRDVSYNGVISNDFRKDDYKIINFDSIFADYLKDNVDVVYNEMNLGFIDKVLRYRYRDYQDSDKIVDSIMDKMKSYFLLDILIGNYDNGKYNYEIMENDRDALVCPYYDFGNTFSFKNTRFTCSDSKEYDIYINLSEFLATCDNMYIDRFIYMYNNLTPDKLEEIFLEIEYEKDIILPDNFKNILFLAYSRHYEKIGNIIVNYQDDKSFVK